MCFRALCLGALNGCASGPCVWGHKADSTNSLLPQAVESECRQQTSAGRPRQQRTALPPVPFAAAAKEVWEGVANRYWHLPVYFVPTCMTARAASDEQQQQQQQQQQQAAGQQDTAAAAGDDCC